MQSCCRMLSIAASSTTIELEKRSVKCLVHQFMILSGVMNVVEESFDFNGTQKLDGAD